MTNQHRAIEETARLWAIRAQDPTFNDWDGLTGWLEQDAAHLAAYDAAIDAGDWADELFRHQPPRSAEPVPFAGFQDQPEPRAPGRKRWYAFGGAIAAVVVGVATFSVFGLGGAHEIVTGPGEHRTIPLADGSKIVLNGGTRITINPDDPRDIELASGEVLFDVRHDARHPFVVTTTDGTRLLDAGTVFNVISDAGTLDVAVAEGEVIYQPGREAIRLTAGNGLSRGEGQAKPVLRKASPQAVGGWQQGQLEYNDAPLELVARDLGRNLGRAIRPTGGAERLRFTGTLVVDGRTDEVLKRAGPLLGVDFTADGEAWRMTPAHGAAPY